MGFRSQCLMPPIFGCEIITTIPDFLCALGFEDGNRDLFESLYSFWDQFPIVYATKCPTFVKSPVEVYVGYNALYDFQEFWAYVQTTSRRRLEMVNPENYEDMYVDFIAFSMKCAKVHYDYGYVDDAKEPVLAVVPEEEVEELFVKSGIKSIGRANLKFLVRIYDH